MIDIQSNSFLKNNFIKSSTVLIGSSKHGLFISRQMHHVKIGVSMGWSGLGLCPTRTQHDHFRWRKSKPEPTWKECQIGSHQVSGEYRLESGL